MTPPRNTARGRLGRACSSSATPRLCGFWRCISFERALAIRENVLRSFLDSRHDYPSKSPLNYVMHFRAELASDVVVRRRVLAHNSSTTTTI